MSHMATTLSSPTQPTHHTAHSSAHHARAPIRPQDAPTPAAHPNTTHSALDASYGQTDANRPPRRRPRARRPRDATTRPRFRQPFVSRGLGYPGPVSKKKVALRLRCRDCRDFPSPTRGREISWKYMIPLWWPENSLHSLQGLAGSSPCSGDRTDELQGLSVRWVRADGDDAPESRVRPVGRRHEFLTSTHLPHT